MRALAFIELDLYNRPGPGSSTFPPTRTNLYAHANVTATPESTVCKDKRAMKYSSSI